jgi:hypothetical protein
MEQKKDSKIFRILWARECNGNYSFAGVSGAIVSEVSAMHSEQQAGLALTVRHDDSPSEQDEQELQSVGAES